MVLIGGVLMLALLVAIISSVSADRPNWMPLATTTQDVENSYAG
jgi:hypothetical protein